jgi:hypothetical protein
LERGWCCLAASPTASSLSETLKRFRFPSRKCCVCTFRRPFRFRTFWRRCCSESRRLCWFG